MMNNVVVIVVDALRRDRVGACGSDFSLTPNIDSLAKTGTVFTNAFTAINATDPALTSLHTGRFPDGHGIVNHGSRVTKNEKQAVKTADWMPDSLQHEGYHTGWYGRHLGRWHHRGFDTHPTVNSSSIKRLVGKLIPEIYGETRRPGNVVREFFDDVQNRPFYSLIHLLDTHIPYEPDSESVDQYTHRCDETDVLLSELAKKYGADSWTREKCRQWSEQYADGSGGVGTAHMNARYDATVREADRKVGEILTGLSRRDLLDETMVVVLSDHGESLTEHDILYDHHGLYDQTVRIPLVIRLPDQVDQAGVVEELVQITDVAPTVLDYLSVSSSFEADGKSLKPLIEGGVDWGREAVVAEEAHTQRRKMIRTAGWKYIWSIDGDTTCRYCGLEHAGPEELYDLEADPRETTNFVEERSGKTRSLEKRYEEITEEFLEVESEERGAVEYEDEEEVIERLKELGYR